MNEKIDIFDVEKPKQKLFGERAVRVSTAEMDLVFEEIHSMFSETGYINRMESSKPLPSKMDHGDVDIVVENSPKMDIKEYIRSNLVYHGFLIESVNNGPILHCLFASKVLKKQVHVDFIFSNSEEFDSSLMYLAYNDFSGILGVIARKLKFNYGNKGIFKIYVDKKGQYHYILLSRSLVDGLKMLGYADILPNYYKIQNNNDVAHFLSYSDLFDSEYMSDNDLNRGDRKRMRASRQSARELRNELRKMKKSRIQMDDDFFLKQLFPEIYSMYLEKCREIDSYVPPKSKYNGHFILNNVAGLKPGPIVGKIQMHLFSVFGENLESVDENEVLDQIQFYLKSV